MIKSLTIYAFAALVLVLAAGAVTHAMTFASVTPEFHPGVAIASFTMLGGTIAIFRARRQR